MNRPYQTGKSNPGVTCGTSPLALSSRQCWGAHHDEVAADGVETPIGRLSTPGALERLLNVDSEGWITEMLSMCRHYKKFGNKLPDELAAELDNLEARLKAAK